MSRVRLRTLGLVPVLVAAACGDNLLSDGVPLAQTADVVIVAHQDDDLLFMQPDLVEAVRSGGGVTSIYVTAGNGTKDWDKSQRRYEGLMAAYGDAANADAWTCGWIELAGHTAEHCRLAERNISLVFLAYPDGGIPGDFSTSLLHLWQGDITSAETVAQRTTVYDRAGLIEAIAHVLRETQPTLVRTLEVAATHGYDHSDHMIVGSLAVLAMARANNHADLLSYRGYSMSDEPENKIDPVFEEIKPILGRYEACATDCGECGGVCTNIVDSHLKYLRRRYAVGFRSAVAGRLRFGTECLALDATLGPCTAAPVWTLDATGQLRSDLTCLAVAPDGTVSPSACLGGAERRFFLDDEGHLWSGVPPLPEAGMAHAHLWCLDRSDTGAVRARLCGASTGTVFHDAPTWEAEPPTHVTPRQSLGMVATGRDVRLGDLTGDGFADLCAIEGNRLMCAPGDGAGGFGPAEPIDYAARPLVVEPRSLTLGDVDGDGALDACGRNSRGVVCATEASGYWAMDWSPAFNAETALPTTSASLAAIDANADGVADICGTDLTGVVCASHGMTAQLSLRSPWPDAEAVVWSADLDGDHQADWCAATDAGPACGAFAQSDLTTDGVPWGYAFKMVVDVAPANTATVALADIDGDGRADLCSPREDRIVCARSQGRGFGPRTTLAILPNQATASALWLGDLNGDGRADACVDSGANIICAVAP